MGDSQRAPRTSTAPVASVSDRETRRRIDIMRSLSRVNVFPPEFLETRPMIRERRQNGLDVGGLTLAGLDRISKSGQCFNDSPPHRRLDDALKDKGQSAAFPPGTLGTRQ